MLLLESRNAIPRGGKTGTPVLGAPSPQKSSWFPFGLPLKPLNAWTTSRTHPLGPASATATSGPPPGGRVRISAAMASSADCQASRLAARGSRVSTGGAGFGAPELFGVGNGVLRDIQKETPPNFRGADFYVGSVFFWRVPCLGGFKEKQRDNPPALVPLKKTHSHRETQINASLNKSKV